MRNIRQFNWISHMYTRKSNSTKSGFSLYNKKIKVEMQEFKKVFAKSELEWKIDRNLFLNTKKKSRKKDYNTKSLEWNSREKCYK